MDSYNGLSVNRAIKTVRAHKGHRKQCMQWVEGLISLLEGPPSVRLNTDLQTEIESYINQTNDIAAGLQYLMLTDNVEERIGKYKREMANLGTEDAVLITRARVAMTASTEPETTFHVGPSANSNNKDNEGAAQRPRINKGLKPKPLRQDASPEEFRSWAKHFKAFYASSLQRAYLHMCLDITLETAISSKIKPDTRIFKDEGNPEDNYCIQHLEELFLRKYPLATRRYNYIDSCQPRGMAMSTLISTLKKTETLKKKAEEAKIVGLRPEQLFLLMYIISCTDKELKRRMLECDDPTPGS